MDSENPLLFYRFFAPIAAQGETDQGSVGRLCGDTTLAGFTLPMGRHRQRVVLPRHAHFDSQT